MNHKLMFVGENPKAISAVAGLLKNEPIETYWFKSPLRALAGITLIAPQVVLSSQDMPEMDGVPFLDAVGKIFPDSVRLIMAGRVMPEYATGAVLNGYVTKFLPRPWDDATLLHEIRSAFFHYESANDPVQVHCAVCGRPYSVNAIPTQSAYYRCDRCSRSSAPTATEMTRRVAGMVPTVG